MPEFEVLLISIDWESPNKVRNIIPSKKYLKASKIEGSKYEYDIVLYNKEDDLYFQFAIKTRHFPKIKENGNWMNLYRIENTDYWINKGIWDKGSRGNYYHKCQSINTIGKIEIGLRDDYQKPYFIKIDINSNIDDFDFAQLKNDFEGELWNLITSANSKVTTSKIEYKHGDKTIRFPENKQIIDFLTEFDKISKNPKRELSQTKEFRRIEKVIPIAETYRKLSTAGTSKLLPSKSVLENYDIYENRYVCFMLYKIHQIVEFNTRFSKQKIEKLFREINIVNVKIIELQKPQILNEEKVLEDIKYQEQNVIRVENKWKVISSKLNYNRSANYIIKKVTLWKEDNELSNTYWSFMPEFCLITFPNIVSSYLKEGVSFKIEVIHPNNKSGKTNKGKAYQIINVNDIKSIVNSDVELEQSILLKKIKNAEVLKRNNWLKVLTPQEVIEQKNQIQTLNRDIAKLKFQLKNIGEFNEEQTSLQPLLAQRLKSTFFKNIKWKNFQVFKPSMTFIQNINYRNAIRYYNEILKSEGIDIEIFDLYANLESFGLREMPQIYELWCLVTQIKVLEDSFHFEHEPRDLTALLKAIDPKKQTIADYCKIDFKNSLAGRRVTLHYQKSIAENKRPDFILEVTYNGQSINLVLDSKFKNYNYKKSIVYETMDMNNKYGGDKNFVFILHPCKDGTYNNKLVKYTNFGGDRISFGEEQQEIYPFHEFGYIELKPNFTGTLNKLIAMSFEYLLEPSRNAKQNSIIDPKPVNDMFCISCGKANVKITQLPRENNRFHYNCTCNETDCGHKTFIDYCWNCKSKLFKHGSYWDYHLESTWSIFDIRCPNCGMTVADRPNTNEF